MDKYDLIIIGAGPGGYVSAIRAAQLGLKALVIEKSKIGGTCLNRGCIPTKALLHSSHLYAEAAEGGRSGIHAEGLSYNMDEILERKTQVSTKLTDGIKGLFKANKIDCIEGCAQILEPGKVSACGEVYDADKILIATGLIPAVPPFPGHDLPGVVTSNDILEGPVIDPKSITVIGGSVIGVELATFYAQLGIKVTVIEALDQLLTIVDKEFGAKLRNVLKKQGVDVFVKSAVQRIEKTEEGLTCWFETKGKEQSVTSEYVLVATGRKPDMAGLFAEGLEPEMNGRYIKVNEKFETSIKGVYSIGDIIGGIQLAHVSAAEGASCIEMMAGVEPEVDLAVVPSCIYSDPEIATVGMTAEQAAEAGYEVLTGKYLMPGNGKSIIEFQDTGFIKVIADAATGKILGAHLMCQRASDIVGEFGTAIANRMTYRDMLKAMKPHPSFAEGVQEALEALEGRSIHSAPVRK